MKIIKQILVLLFLFVGTIAWGDFIPPNNIGHPSSYLSPPTIGLGKDMTQKAINLINSSHTESLSSGNSFASGALNITAGNAILVFVQANGNGTTITSSVSDSAGNSYSLAGRAQNLAVAGTLLEIWVATDVDAYTGNVVTATFSSTSVNHSIAVSQWEGLATENVIDTNYNPSGAIDMTSPYEITGTTSQSNCLIFGGYFIADLGASFSSHNPSILISSSSTPISAAFVQLAPFAGSYTSGVLDSTSVGGIIFARAFKGATTAYDFPTTSVLDDFNRASLGEDWTVGSGSWEISSNQLAPTNSGASSLLYDPGLYDADQEVYFTIGTLPTTGGTDSVGMFFRMASTNGYLLILANDTADNLRLEKITGGNTDGELVRFYNNFTAGDKLGVRCIGNDISVFHGRSGVWIKLFTWVDSSYNQDGTLALYARGTAGRVDDFGGGDYTPFGLVSPTNTITDVTLPVTFTWNPHPNANVYLLQVSENSNMSSPVIDVLVYDTEYIESNVLDSSTTYYWRVFAGIETA